MIRGRKQCDTISGCGKFYNQHLPVCPHCNTPEAFADFILYNPLDWIYDLETYPNIVTADFKHPLTGTRQLFEISDRKNDSVELYNFLNSLAGNGCRMVGYNNLAFDYPIIHFFIEYFRVGLTVHDLYNKAQQILTTPWENRFDNIIWDNERHIVQIDLFKIHHFDNEARRTSLKMLEFNMRLNNISDLPFPPGTILNNEEQNELIIYNDDDVDATECFYFETLEMITFREELNERYKRNFLNHSDKKIGSDLFIAALEQAKPGSCYTYNAQNKRVARQTHRDSIVLSDIIFPYIQFNKLGFQHILNWLKNQTITKTKGVFEFIEVSYDMALVMDPKIIKVYNLPETNKGIPFDQHAKYSNIESLKFISGVKDKSGLNCVVDGFTYVFGTGGIHGSIDPTIINSNDDYVIVDWDVEGFYPEVGGANKLYPAHLSEQFCIVNEALKQERQKYDKGTALNKTFKLAKNAAFGDSNNNFSSFKDPQYTMSITINGQLLLCMLAQYLIDIPGLQMIQMNTDGLTVRCPRKHVESMNKICDWWQSYTCLKLENAIYSRMFIRDVNNYIGEYDKDKSLKRKGAYCYERIAENPGTLELEWHKNHSALVIPKAAETALVHGQDIRDFIENHDDIFDFMLRAKVGRNEKLMLKDLFGNEYQLQNISRYYISNGINAGELTKVSPPTKGYQVGQWKRASGLTDQFYRAVLAELRTGDHTHQLGHDLDATGLPWDVRINTKNRSMYKIRITNFQSGYLVRECNNIHHARRDDINIDYYVAETEKLVNPLRNM